MNPVELSCGRVVDDIFEFVALWNRKYIDISYDYEPVRVKSRNEFVGLCEFEKNALAAEGKTPEEIAVADENRRDEHYQTALECKRKFIESAKDFAAGVSDSEMEEKYGCDWLREIGITIACDDNASLKYPIKIVEYLAPYSNAFPSENDPDQGRERFYT